MIFSDKQYTVAQQALEKLQTALLAVRAAGGDKQEWLRKIEADALESQISDIEVEIQEYEMLRDGQISFSERFSLADLPRILIQARIAQGMSQTELASALNMKPQQIQRYEATEYMGASLARLIEVSNLLGVRTTESFSTAEDDANGVYAWSGANTVAWDRFPGKEMIKRGWLSPGLGESTANAVRSYFDRVAGPQFASVLHRKKIRGENRPDEIALLAWQARILDIAQQRMAGAHLPVFEQDETWLPELRALTLSPDGPRKAVDLLWQHGIILAIEPHLPGSYLDGAAMLTADDKPVIGLTLRYDRLDNFWFVLFHELAHVFLHLFDSLHFDFFDEEGPVGDDHLEAEADAFALNALIADEDWARCLSRFALTDEAVKIDSERLGVHASIVAGRIRKERGDYTILTDLIGNGEVRARFMRGGP
ncbi:MAG: helix-turn-helix domain-containing protein [Hyphomonas sp.]|nr:helix-turn-helix domain-containing protein [Hyphomonas sp.]